MSNPRLLIAGIMLVTSIAKWTPLPNIRVRISLSGIADNPKWLTNGVDHSPDGISTYSVMAADKASLEKYREIKRPSSPQYKSTKRRSSVSRKDENATI